MIERESGREKMAERESDREGEIEKRGRGGSCEIFLISV